MSSERYLRVLQIKTQLHAVQFRYPVVPKTVIENLIKRVIEEPMY